MPGKVNASGDTGAEAIARLRRALAQTWLPGLVTNREHVHAILGHPEFAAGAIDTHFLERHRGAVLGEATPAQRQRAALVAAVAAHLARLASSSILPAIPPGWRNVPSPAVPITFAVGEHSIAVACALRDGAGTITVAGTAHPIRHAHLEVTGAIVVEEATTGQRSRHRVHRDGLRTWVDVDGLTLRVDEAPRFPDRAAARPAGSLTAPMPGKVIKVLVASGDVVALGAALLILEAMKLEHTVRAPQAGTVSALHVTVGEQVGADQILAVVS